MAHFSTYSMTLPLNSDGKINEEETFLFEEFVNEHVLDGFIILPLQVTPVVVGGTTVAVIYTQSMYFPIKIS
jgi:hypothetical protein